MAYSKARHIKIKCQCSKLRVHPAPGVHILSTVCTNFSLCAPSVCRLFSSILIPLCEEEHMNELPGA